MQFTTVLTGWVAGVRGDICVRGGIFFFIYFSSGDTRRDIYDYRSGADDAGNDKKKKKIKKNVFRETRIFSV